jgi:hypothetical protein
MNSNWEDDLNSEQEVAKFLDKYFYQKKMISFKRITDVDSQYEGIDIILSYNDLKNILVDEKAQCSYVNKNLPTFAFEVNFIKNNKLCDGWLFSNNKKTEYYFLVWIKAKKEKHFTFEDIIELNCILVERKEIIDYLSKYSIDKNKSYEIAEHLRETKTTKFSNTNFEGFNFNFSNHLSEKPVNIVIQKEVLINLAHGMFVVKPD